MPAFKFVSAIPLYYSDLGLMAEPGDEREFDSPPDHRWIPATPDEVPEPVSGSGGVVLPKPSLSKSQSRRIAAMGVS
jgi:hypothetical protein